MPTPQLRMFLLGRVVPHLGFGWEWRAAYLHEPLTILDIRNGGWETVTGFAATCFYGLILLRRQSALRKSLMAAAFALLTSWTAGEVAFDGTGGSCQLLPALGGRSVALVGFVGKPTVFNLRAT